MQFLQRRIPYVPPLCRWWWPSALARQDVTTTLMPTSTAYLDCLPLPQNRLSRFVYKPWRTCPLNPIAPASTSGLCTLNVSTGATKESECEPPSDDNVYVVPVIANSSHRDGLIYKNKFIREDLWEGDIANRNETQLEPMRFSKATERCLPVAENCIYHFPEDMFQIFSVLLSKSTITQPIQLYGYIAARDVEDGMLNYVVNYSRDDPIVVQQGSLIEMTGPKRGIRMTSLVLIEFDMRIKNGAQEDDDEQLIDGAISCYDHCPNEPIKYRVIGNCGAVDMSLGIVPQAVEATIEVIISELQSGLSLSLSSFVDVMDDFEEIKLFHGTVFQPGALRRFVVAVPWYSVMFLNFKVGNDVARQIIFEAKKHGYASRQIKLKVAAMSVKVTWSTI
ncbi:unnamed protein product [Urochloa decumbens]|uniref:DUF6598 domain-containing protein n=2 Tax=Urochloa decumbens TaxID=240449 RepID=A0ABC9EE62_9POAL